MVEKTILIALMLPLGLVCVIVGNIIYLTLNKKVLDTNSYIIDSFQYIRKFSVWLIEKGYWLIYNWMKPVDNIKIDDVLLLLDRHDW